METTKVAAVGDIHYGSEPNKDLKPLFEAMSNSADVVVLCGDLTHYGLAHEAERLVRDLNLAIKKPVVAVLGNHDFESGQERAVAEILINGGVNVLDGHAIEVAGVGFAGAKGFGGGFGAHELQPWGEEPMKAFVRASIEEAMKLEAALANIKVQEKVVVLHYSPIQSTVQGEPAEIQPFLGSSHLEDAVDRFSASVVFHGHAHEGSLKGYTRGEVPVFNVALPLLSSKRPGQPPFVVWDVPARTLAAAS
jgi:Icc-related predicted phosphoesterase